MILMLNVNKFYIRYYCFVKNKQFFPYNITYILIKALISVIFIWSKGSNSLHNWKYHTSYILIILVHEVESISATYFTFRDTSDKRTSATWKKSTSKRYIQINQNALMWNTAFKEHASKSPVCSGFLHWDMKKEEIRGLGCREQMICTHCSYRSKYFTFYEEIQNQQTR